MIAISGQVGSGKSTVAALLAMRLGVERVSTGEIQRGLAAARGLGTLEFNLLSEDQTHLDDLIDHRIIELRGSGREIVVDSRMAWFFLPEAFKVFLVVDPDVAVQRVLGDAGRVATERYETVEAAKKEIRARQESERRRFRSKYGVDYTDFAKYDLVVDTSDAAPQATVELIVRRLAHRESREPELWLSPKRLLPTQHVRTLAGESARALAAIRDRIGFWSEFPVSVVDVRGRYFILDGHKRVSAVLRADVPFVRVAVRFREGEEIVSGLSAVEYAEHECVLSQVYDWEDAHGFRFRSYPERPGGPS